MRGRGKNGEKRGKKIQFKKERIGTFSVLGTRRVCSALESLEGVRGGGNSRLFVPRGTSKINFFVSLCAGRENSVPCAPQVRFLPPSKMKSKEDPLLSSPSRKEKGRREPTIYLASS